jgi:hypothetical protein
MKVVNEYLATKEGLTAGEMEEKIEGLVDILQKGRLRCHERRR